MNPSSALACPPPAPPPERRAYLFSGNPLEALGVQADTSQDLDIEQINDFACVRAGDHVLVVGSQRGKIADRFRKAGAVVDCIEHERIAAAMCRAGGHRVLFCDFLEQTPPDDGYDIAVVWPGRSMDVVAHVTHTLAMVKSRAIVIAVVPVVAEGDVVSLVADGSVFDSAGDDAQVIILMEAPVRSAPIADEPPTEEEAA